MNRISRTLALAWLASVAPAFADDVDPAPNGDPGLNICRENAMAAADLTLTHAVWKKAGVVELTAPAIEDARVVMHGRLSFGPIQRTWTRGPGFATAGQTRRFKVAIPQSVFPHPMASTYVADLNIQLEIQAPDGTVRQEVALPPLWVAWPNGPGGDPVVWLPENGPPHGVLDPQLQALADTIAPGARIGPPILAAFPGRFAVEEDVSADLATSPLGTTDLEVTP